MLTPETIERIFLRKVHSPDNRSTGDRFTINTVDYGTVDANIGYPGRAQLIAAAATTLAAHAGPSPVYPHPSSSPDYLLAEKDDITIFPNIDDHKMAALSPQYATDTATAPPASKKITGFPGQLALYRAFVLHFTDRYDNAVASFPPLPEDFGYWNKRNQNQTQNPLSQMWNAIHRSSSLPTNPLMA